MSTKSKSTKFKPMLAASAKTSDIEKLKFPLYASIKLDGIRAIVIDSVVYSRSLKPIRNNKVQELFGKPEYNGFDGELILGEPNDPNAFNNSTALMGTELRESVRDLVIGFFIFDIIPEYCTEEEANNATLRLQALFERISNLQNNTNAVLVHQKIISNLEQLHLFEKQALDAGYEGVMVKSVDGEYKLGRSTFKQGSLVKIKRFQDSEAKVIGYEAKKKNIGERETTKLGYSKTSSKKDDFIELETLGALIVEDLESGIQFKIGSGFDDKTRLEIWDMKDELEGNIVKYKHFSIGVKEAPRFPTWIGFRDLDDLDDISK